MEWVEYRFVNKSTQIIGKVHQPIHTFFSNARRLTEGALFPLSGLSLTLWAAGC